MTTYALKEDRFGERFVSRDDGQYIVGAKQVRGEVWGSATAVLVADEATVEAVAWAIRQADGLAGQHVSAAAMNVSRDRARAALDILRTRATGGTR